jgi:hypothetical protein
MDAMAQQRSLDFASLHLNRLRPSAQRPWFLRPGTSRSKTLKIEADFQKLIEKGEADPLFPLEFLAKLLIGPLGVGGETVEAGLQGISCFGQGLLE